MASNDLKPLPVYKQYALHAGALWRRKKIARQLAYKTFRTGAAKLLTLAISVLGATLISYGVYQVYPPAGYVTGGIICWLLLWSHEQDKRRSRS
jgi:hypothetical protein